MVCIVCLAADLDRELTITGNNAFRVELCKKHGVEVEQVLRKWIHSNRETAVIEQAEKAKEGKPKDWKEQEK